MEQRREEAKYCDFCAADLSTAMSAQDFKVQKQEAEKLDLALMAELERISVSTLPSPVGKSNYEVLGLVLGTSSKQAF